MLHIHCAGSPATEPQNPTATEPPMAPKTPIRGKTPPATPTSSAEKVAKLVKAEPHESLAAYEA